MQSENYIYKYYNLPKCTVKLNQLKIRVLNSIYNQYFNFFINNTTGRQKTHVAKQLCKLWFFIHFNCSLGNSKLSNELLGFVIGSTNRNQLISYKNKLNRLHLIEITNNLKEYTKEITITLLGESFNCTALLDSGNLLKDPISKSDVIMINPSLLSKYLPENYNYEKLNLIHQIYLNKRF